MACIKVHTLTDVDARRSRVLKVSVTGDAWQMHNRNLESEHAIDSRCINDQLYEHTWSCSGLRLLRSRARGAAG